MEELIFVIIICPVLFARIGKRLLRKVIPHKRVLCVLLKSSIIIASVLADITTMHIAFWNSTPPVWPFLLGLVDDYDGLDVFFLLIILGLSLLVLGITYCIPLRIKKHPE